MKKLISLAMIFFCLHVIPLFGYEQYSLDEKHRGILSLGKFQIFPENRIGNALYLEHQQLISFPDRVIFIAREVQGTDLVAYLYRNNSNEVLLDIYDPSDSIIFKQIDPELYEIWIPQLRARRLFRIYQNDIVPLLPKAKTATGLTPSSSHAAFYHISASEKVLSEENEGPSNQRIYTFRIHIVNRQKAGYRTIPRFRIRNTAPSLKMEWLNQTTLQYQLSNGTIGSINVQEWLPNYF